MNKTGPDFAQFNALIERVRSDEQLNRDRFDNLTNKVAQLADLVTKPPTENVELEKQVHVLEERNRTLGQEYLKADNERSELRRANTGLAYTVDSLRNDLKYVREERDMLKTNLAITWPPPTWLLQQKLDAAEKQVKTMRGELERIWKAF